MPRGGSPKRGPQVSTAAMKHVTSGTFNIAYLTSTGEQYIIATSNEVAAPALYLKADDKDEMYSWIRLNAFIFDSADDLIFEYALIRCLQDDALQALDDADTLEYLMKEKRILKRGIHAAPCYGATTGSVPKKLAFELYQVKLRTGEELRLIIRPIYPAITGNSVHELGTLEWRKVGD